MDASKLTVDDVEKIKDQNQLLEIVKNPDFDIRVRIRAADNIEDKSILADYAYDGDIFLRMQAIRQVNNDEILLDLILNDSSDFVRHEAGTRFIDYCDSEKYEDVLLEFALENPKYAVFPLGDTDTMARFACMRIKDTSKLMEVVKKSKSIYVYRYAMRAVGNDALSELLYSGELDRDKEIMVAERLKDYKKLSELLYGGKLNHECRIRVAMGLKDDEKLRELLKVPLAPKSKYIPNDGDDEDNIHGSHVVSDMFPGDEIYTTIVFDYPNRKIAIKALNLIGYKSNLKYIMENHKDPRICKAAASILERTKNSTYSFPH
ncbi:MAG: hypothetical protein IK044_05945 [Methanobrevibacter sp.]|nr:hypothetical protein [Methanobrevibacter sp.]